MIPFFDPSQEVLHYRKKKNAKIMNYLTHSNTDTIYPKIGETCSYISQVSVVNDKLNIL